MKVKNSLDEILYEHIVESLINGDYEMGQNLTLDELAHRFEVSRTPVVQAVKLLANDGSFRSWVMAASMCRSMTRSMCARCVKSVKW